MRSELAPTRHLTAPPASRTGEAYRHELKYRISEAEKAALTLRLEALQPILRRDPHAQGGGYFIRSLYFEDCWNSAYAEKDAGVLLRKKYRIRIYDCSDRIIKLERKKKCGSWIYKEEADLTHEQLDCILKGDYGFLRTAPKLLCREFYYECLSNLLRPRVIVDYDREPWVMDEGTVRITFDEHIRAAVGGWNLFDPNLPTLPVLEAGTLILEVKFTEFLPGLVRQLLPPRAQEMTAASKYVLCCDRTAYLHGAAHWREV